MRVISGVYRKARLAAPEGLSTRPTTDRVKENLFNILPHHLAERRVLDLFSGSGALGIEALSRGAEHVIFIEQNNHALKVLESNLAHIKAPNERYKIVPGDVEDFLKSGEKYAARASISLVLADPPYQLGWYDKAVALLESSKLCAIGCLAVFEMDTTKKVQIDGFPWELIDERVYGKVRLEFIKKNS